MSLTKIRQFSIAEQLTYRHAIDTNTDDVFLQRYNANAETPEDEWQNLLRYDANCNVWDVSTDETIGRFFIRDEHWLFDPRVLTDECPSFVTCEHTRGVESLLDSEVTISKRWLKQQADPNTDAARLAAHRDLHRTVHPDIAEAARATKRITELAEALDSCIMRLEWFNDPRTGNTEAPWIKYGRKVLAQNEILTNPILALMTQQRNDAIKHLQALLNTQRTATQALESEHDAREWLESIGSKPQ